MTDPALRPVVHADALRATGVDADVDRDRDAEAAANEASVSAFDTDPDADPAAGVDAEPDLPAEGGPAGKGAAAGAGVGAGPLGAVGVGAGQADPDAALVARAREGSQKAFEMLVVKHQGRIFQLAARMVGENDAGDVAQETFVKAWRSLKGFQGNSAFYTWLYRIAVNTAKNHLASRGRRAADQDIEVSEAEEYGHLEYLADYGTPEAETLSEEIKQTVTAAIQALPPDLRRAILLREMEGLSYEDIAALMNCPIGTVRSRIFRAREAIDAVLEPLIGN